jgi:hypothetical protein
VGDDRVYAELQFAARMGFPVTPELAAIYIQQLMALDIEEGEGHLWDTSPFGLAQNPTHLLPLGLQVAEPQPTTAPAQQPTPHAEVVEEDVVAETQPKSKPVLWANATLQNALTGASELLKK